MNRIPGLTTGDWRKSSYSDGGGTNCVEVADDRAGLVPVRDSKVPDGGMLVFGTASWDSFVTGVKSRQM
ncbi:DUF397 domain-containing protein [Streptomyces hirsutus]|uniref:DUF397 domain-containing protein n=1 Tax=Streptomyces hirsutus TaxID=35620 RepID=UPI00332084D4